MMTKELIPTNEEVKRWLISTLQHSCGVEYYLEKLTLGKDDPERPHDLVGPNNKFEWKVILGMALVYRRPKVDFEKYILPAISLHRQQYHHRMWNDPDPDDITKQLPCASGSDMMVGAVDAACSLLENRVYSGGNEQNEQNGRRHSWEEIEDALYNHNPAHKVPWSKIIVPQMKKLKQPNLELITSLENFPNIGLSSKTYDAIAERTHKAVKFLGKEMKNTTY